MPPPLGGGLLHLVPLRGGEPRGRDSRGRQRRSRRRRRGSSLGRKRREEFRNGSHRVRFHPQKRLEVGIDVFFVLAGGFLGGGFGAEVEGSVLLGGGQGDVEFAVGAERADGCGVALWEESW